MSLVCISKAVVSRIEEEVISLSVLYFYLSFSLSLLWFQLIFMPFHLSYVAVSRPLFTLTGPLLLGLSVSFRQKKVMAVYQ